MRKVATQAEFDLALRDGEVPEIVSDGRFDITQAKNVRVSGSSQPHVVAWGSSQPHVEAWGSSQPHVEARESFQPHVVALESSQPHVEARGSSQPHVVAWGSSQPHVEASAFAQVAAEQFASAAISVDAGPRVAVLATGSGVAVTGGGYVVRRERPKTGAEWCEYYGVKPREDGTVILFKAVNDDWRGSHKTAVTYEPGATPVAPDWNPVPECGGGLHFCPAPAFALRFCSTATHYIGCPVALNEVVVHPDGDYPEKCKAPRGCGPCFEVTIDGERITPEVPAPSPAVTKRAKKSTKSEAP